MGEFNPERFVPIVPLEGVQETLRNQLDTPRILANVVVASASDLTLFKDGYAETALLKLNEKTESDVFASQIISKRALQKLRAHDYAGFLKQRGRDMISRAKQLAQGT